MTNYLQKGTLGEPQVRAERRNGWTKSRRDAFLNHLSMTCNVDQSCAAVGMSDSSAYQLRRRDEAFAAQWRMAIATGYDRLEAALLEHAMRAVATTEHGAVSETPFDPEMAMQILGQHHARQTGRGKPGGRPLRRATPAETDAAILKQLAALDRRMKAKVRS